MSEPDKPFQATTCTAPPTEQIDAYNKGRLDSMIEALNLVVHAGNYQRAMDVLYLRIDREWPGMLVPSIVADAARRMGEG